MTDKNHVLIVGSGAKHLKLNSSIDVELSNFNNNECRVQLKESVRHRHVIIIQSFNDPNNHLMELFLIIDAAKRAMAKSVNVILPIFPYSRQDRKPDSGSPISARVVCDFLKALNVDRVITIDLHATQIQGFLDNEIGFDHISSCAFLAFHLKKYIHNLNNTIICSPDAGGVKRAKKLQKLMGVPDFCMLTKDRNKPGEIEHIELTGDVLGKKVIIFDDMIDTAGTLEAGIDALYHAGAIDVSAVATHGLFSGPAYDRLENVSVYVTNTLDIIDAPKNINIIDITTLVSDLISRIVHGEHLSDLFQKWSE